MLCYQTLKVVMLNLFQHPFIGFRNEFGMTWKGNSWQIAQLVKKSIF